MFDQIPTFPLDTPALRPLEIVPVRVQGQELLMIRDPLGLLEGPALLMPDPLLLIFLEMADGKTTLGEMAQKVTQLTQQLIPVGIFEKLVAELDKNLLLQSTTFAEAMAKKYEEWNKSTVRPHRIFKAEGMDRLKMLKDLGDEFRRHRMSHYSPPERLDLPAGSVKAILSPHIDFARSGEAYAWAYRALKECGTGAKTFIILGTSHRPASHRFIATKKNYETPFGTLETDQEMLAEIEAAFGGQLYESEYYHAEEHTVELQATYLKQIYQDQDIRIVPILVAPFDDLFEEEGSPAESDAEVQPFINALRTVMEKYGDKVALIGGVDFSHCGPEFGDEELNEPARAKAIEIGDREALEKAEALDGAGFFNTFRHDYNGRKVCSIGTVYTVLEVLKGVAKGKLLTYQQSVSPDKNNLVSFSAMAFLKPDAEIKPASRIILLG